MYLVTWLLSKLCSFNCIHDEFNIVKTVAWPQSWILAEHDHVLRYKHINPKKQKHDYIVGSLKNWTLTRFISIINLSK